MRQKLAALLINMFTQGVSPRKLAFTISLGVFIGTIPAVWGSALICAGLAALFRLNHLGIQAANHLVYPLQIALIVPFYRIGAAIFPWGPSLSAEMFSQGIKNAAMGSFVPLAVATVKALAAWLLIASPLAVLLYFILWPVFAVYRPVKGQTTPDSTSSEFRKADPADHE